MSIGKCIWIRLDKFCYFNWLDYRFDWCHFDVLWKDFRNYETIEEMSKQSEHEIKHRIFETRLARFGAILLIIGFCIQIIGYGI